MRALGRTRRVGLDDLATIIFSSGSTGDPKGVMLTHYNVASNIEQMGQVFMLGGHDRILGILPFFHSYGYTTTLWTPLTLEPAVVYHTDPRDGQTVGRLALSRRAHAAFPLSKPAHHSDCGPERGRAARPGGGKQPSYRFGAAWQRRRELPDSA